MNMPQFINFNLIADGHLGYFLDGIFTNRAALNNLAYAF